MIATLNSDIILLLFQVYVLRVSIGTIKYYRVQSELCIDEINEPMYVVEPA